MPATVLQDLIEKIRFDGKEFLDPQPGETEDAFNRRLILTVPDISEAAWNALAPDSQNWFNNGAAAVSSMAPIPACPGYQPPHPALAPKAEKATSTVSTRSTASSKVTIGGTKRGVVQRTKELSILHRDWDYKAIMAVLADEGFVPNENSTWEVVNQVNSIFRIADSLGFGFFARSAAEHVVNQAA